MQNNVKRMSVLATLGLLLAACGSTPATPPSGSAAGMVQVNLHVGVPTFARAQGQGWRPQGLPTGPSGMVPELHFNVRVTDGNGKPVAFKDGVYDSSGLGSNLLVLNAANHFGQTLLLPEGTYSFEHAVKDGADDTSSTTLLAYGPVGENTAALSGERANVALRFHAVTDPEQSSLDFAASTAKLFTNSTFNLKLNAKTALLGGLALNIPTSDLYGVKYKVADAIQGTLNGEGSPLGVNVTSLGTTQDPNIQVTATFQAWVRTGADTAALQTLTETFSHAIETNSVNADVTPPSGVSLGPVDGASQGQASLIGGTAQDDVQIASIELFDNMTSVARYDAQQPGAQNLSVDGDTWSTSWTPGTTGSHDLTVVVTDTSGNQSHATQTVNVAQAADPTFVVAPGMDHRVTVPANSELWVRVDASQVSPVRLYMDLYWDSYGQNATRAAVFTSRDSTAQPLAATPFGGNAPYYYGVYSELDQNVNTYWVHLVNTTNDDNEINLYTQGL